MKKTKENLTNLSQLPSEQTRGTVSPYKNKSLNEKQ
jgi:hypothetical protein